MGKKHLVSFAFVGLSFLWPFEVIFPLAKQELDLGSRYPDPWVNQVMADNILLTLGYLAGDPKVSREPFEVSFTLKPGEVFAFHDNLLPEFQGKVVKTTGAHFNWQDGFKSDGWLIGDGVCHLATLMNWVAQEAGLKVTAQVDHDFLPVPGVAKEYGTSIIWMPDGSRGSASQNLYLENTLDFPVTFTFKAQASQVELIISK